MAKLVYKKLAYFLVVNPDSNSQSSVNDSKPKALSMKIKKSRFQRTDSIPASNIDQAQKIPLSSNTKIKDSQPSQPNTKLSAMYPKALLGPVKYSIIKRQVSEPPDFTKEQTKNFMSSVAMVQQKSDKESENQVLNSSSNNNNLLYNNDESHALEDSFSNVENHNLFNLNKKGNLSTSKCNKKTYANTEKKRGRKKKCNINENEVGGKKEKRKRTIIPIDNEIDFPKESGNEIESIIDNDNESKDFLQNSNEYSNNTQPLEEKKVLFNDDQIKKPVNKDLQIARTMSAGNPNSDALVFLDRAVNYLIYKRKNYGDSQQIYRTNSKISSDFPKTPFEYVENRPAPILTHYRNFKHSHKLLGSTVNDFACSHSDDEAQEIYEIIKKKINLRKTDSNDNKCQNEPIKSIFTLESENEIKEDTIKNSDLNPNLPDEKEAESKSKTKQKSKHAYGESSSAEIMNFLKNRINWNSSANCNKSSSGKKSENPINEKDESKTNEELKRFTSLPISKVTVAQQTSEILKKFEKASSDTNAFNTTENKEDKQGPRQKPFIPPYFRDNQNANKPENKIKKPAKKKVSNILDIEKLNQMQDVTRQYGIFDEVYRPFAFKKIKKTSSDEIDKMLDFSNFDGFFDMDDDEMEIFFH